MPSKCNTAISVASLDISLASARVDFSLATVLIPTGAMPRKTDGHPAKAIKLRKFRAAIKLTSLVESPPVPKLRRRNSMPPRQLRRHNVVLKTLLNDLQFLVIRPVPTPSFSVGNGWLAGEGLVLLMTATPTKSYITRKDGPRRRRTSYLSEPSICFRLISDNNQTIATRVMGGRLRIIGHMHKKAGLCVWPDFVFLDGTLAARITASCRR